MKQDAPATVPSIPGSKTAAAARTLNKIIQLFLALVCAGFPLYASIRTPAPTDVGLRESIPRLSLGDEHTCYVPNDGVVRCWGKNDRGQLGTGTFTPGTLPDFVKTNFPFNFKLTLAVATASGNSHGCAVRVGGSVLCWGDNTVGQLGDGTFVQRVRAIQIPGISNAVRIAAGTTHSCALLADGTARCWGFNGSGQLGDGTTINRNAPVPVAGLVNAVAIAAGTDHTCALISNGTVRCWGSNSNGQLGDGTTVNQPLPKTVPSLVNTAAITVGAVHTCALGADGLARCWGLNNNGQLGDGTLVQRLIPTTVSGLTNVTVIAAGPVHTCAILVDGTARCWGRNNVGQLGDGTSGNFRVLPATVVGLSNAVTIAGGSGHTCAITSDGTAFCWGDNGSGQLGNGTFSDSITINPATGIGGSISAKVLAGGDADHNCVLRSNGMASCWGSNSNGQTGNGFPGAQTNPVVVVGVAIATAITADGSHSCALIANGTVRCWGLNNHGQLGDGTTSSHTTALQVPGLANAVAVTAGASHTCALLADGTARCWGANDSGQLGNGNQNQQLSPVAVSGLTNAIAIGAGAAHTCALLADGTARCWGFNSTGQLGNGTTQNISLTPVSVFGLANAVTISTGTSDTCALLADGTARCWGFNLFGQLGDGSRTTRPLPTTVSGLTNAVALETGTLHTCAVTVNGTAHCWGSNADGRLGTGSSDSSLTPVPVVNLSNVVAISATSKSSCALRVDGAVFCWGENSQGQIGDGTTTDATSPVAVPSFTLNINPIVTLDDNPREVTVNIIAACEEGDRLQVKVIVTQGSVSGHGNDHGECIGALGSFPVRVRAQGRGTFQTGSAQVEAEAVFRDRGERSRQEWTRAVQIVSDP